MFTFYIANGKREDSEIYGGKDSPNLISYNFLINQFLTVVVFLTDIFEDISATFAQ
jgi:hypothetical protein